jgi:uncharacterized protein Usg
MKRGRLPSIPSLAQAVSEACKGILAKGKRPTNRSVRQWIHKENDSAPSFNEIAPLVKAWKAELRGGRAVRAVCEAYLSLDAERQKAVRDELHLIPKP